MYTMGFLMHLLIDTVQGAVLGARDTWTSSLPGGEVQLSCRLGK
jgi:hypothetical protein